MSRKLRKSANGAAISNFSLTHKGSKFWNALPWKSIDVSKKNLGEFDDAVFLGLEEVDGNAFLEYKKQNRDPVVDVVTDDQNEANVELLGEQPEKSKKRKRDTKDKEESSDNIVTRVRNDKEKKHRAKSDSELSEDVEVDIIPKKGKKAKKEQEVIEISTETETAESVPKAKKEKKSKKKESAKAVTNQPELDDTPFDLGSNGKWGPLTLNIELCKSLIGLDFSKPTPIQQSAIPRILENRVDVVGVAETGSGKTLAFGIPILNFLLENWDLYRQSPVPAALIISPTRELAMQTTSVLTDLCKNWKAKSRHPSVRMNISIAAVVGGMSEHKQKRLLSQFIHIIVATPGRLCEVMEDDSLPAFQDLSRLRFLVIDEADRIMEEGHFAELNRVFSRIQDHEKITASGEDVRVVMWRRQQGMPEQGPDGSNEGDEDEEVLEMGVNDFDLDLGPNANEIDELIAEQKARGEISNQPYEDEEEETEEDQRLEEEDEGNDNTGGDDAMDESHGEGMDEREEMNDEEVEHHAYGGEFDDEAMDEEDEDDQVHNQVPEFPALPPVEAYQRQTLLFSATGLAARSNLHRTELAQLKKLRLRGTIVGVASDFLLPLSLKKLFSEVGIQKKIEVVDATRRFNSHNNSEEKTGNPQSSTAVVAAHLSKSNDADSTADAQNSSHDKSAVSVLPKQLLQYEIKVPAEDKDIYLYYYLVQHPGRRIIVFVNSIKTCRRVDGLLRALGLACKPLHAELPQRTRLQNLDFLKSQPQAILIATDVAARGVDVDRIATVIHYDVARSPQVYIHRSGRTARNGAPGTALSLVSPDDLAAHHVITKYLFGYQSAITALGNNHNNNNNNHQNNNNGNNQDQQQPVQMLSQNAMPTLTVQMLIIPPLRDRVLLARKIFSKSAQQSRASKESHWAQQQAKEADLFVDGVDDGEADYAYEDQDGGAGDFNAVQDGGDGDDEASNRAMLSKKAKRELAMLKQELQVLLEQPVGSTANTMRSSTGLLLHHHAPHVSTSSNAQQSMRKPGKKARKTKSTASQLAANDWRKRKNGFFVYAR